MLPQPAVAFSRAVCLRTLERPPQDGRARIDGTEVEASMHGTMGGRAHGVALEAGTLISSPRLGSHRSAAPSMHGI